MEEDTNVRPESRFESRMEEDINIETENIFESQMEEVDVVRTENFQNTGEVMEIENHTEAENICHQVGPATNFIEESESTSDASDASDSSEESDEDSYSNDNISESDESMTGIETDPDSDFEDDKLFKVYCDDNDFANLQHSASSSVSTDNEVRCTTYNIKSKFLIS